MRIAIVGGGLGGSTAGILLQQAGFEVAVYEQAPEIQRIGAGIQLQANPTRVLRAIGVEPQLRQIGVSARRWLSREWDTGRILFDIELADWLILHRGDLQVVLNRALKPGSLRFGKRLQGIDERGAELELRFADGSKARADIVIGADGVNSRVREILLGPEEPTYSGFVAYRAIFPAALLGDYRLIADTTKWWSDARHPAKEDRHFLTYYLTARRDEIYFVTGSPDPDWPGGTAPLPASRQEMKKCYEGFHEEVQRVIDACPQASKWPLLERKPLPLWSRGRIVMLGDACHPMKPSMGQGAAMALEDAAVLYRCIKEMPGDPAGAFELYRTNRFERASRIQQESHVGTWMHYPQDCSWVFGYDAMTVPLRG